MCCAVHRKQTLEDHPAGTQSPVSRCSEEPLSTAVFAALLPLSLTKEAGKKILQQNPTKPSGELLLTGLELRPPTSTVGRISSDQHSMKCSHLSFLTPSLSPEGMFFFHTVTADRAAAARCTQLIDTEGAQMRRVFKKKGEIQQEGKKYS